MNYSEWFGAVALAISTALFGFNVFDRVWGGGSNSHKRITDLKESIEERHKLELANVSGVLVELRDRMHLLEIAHWKFKAEVAVEYLRSPEFRIEINEVKSDMAKGFERVDKQYDRIMDAIETTRRANGSHPQH